MDIHFFARSDVGRVRSANEDSYLSEKIADDEYLFIVADGMGGHQAGDVASSLSCAAFQENYRLLRQKGTSILEAMETAVRKANSAILKKAAAEPDKRGMGTTFSSIVIAGMHASIVHIGDSRIYLIRDNKIRKLTVDHSFVEKLVEDGRISPEEAREHPQKNVLYMSLGAREGFSPDISELAVEDGDVFVICSDGLSNMVNDDYIREYAVAGYPEEAADALIKMANANGGSDNITLQIIRIGPLGIMEETRPIRISRPRKKSVTLFAALGVLGLLILFWLVFRPILFDGERRPPAPPEGTAAFLPADPAELAAGAVDNQPPAELALDPADYLFLRNQELVARQGEQLYYIRLDGQQFIGVPVGAEAQVVPSSMAGIYLLRRLPSRQPDFRLLRHPDRKPLLLLQADAQVDVRDVSKHLQRISGLGENVKADFLTPQLLIFHDLSRYYVVKGWNSPDFAFFVPSEIRYTPNSRLFFRLVGGQWRMLYYSPEDKQALLFRLGGNMEKMQAWTGLDGDVALAADFRDDGRLFLYHGAEAVAFCDGRPPQRYDIRFRAAGAHIVRILVDMESGRKLLIDAGGQLFMLEEPA